MDLAEVKKFEEVQPKAIEAFKPINLPTNLKPSKEWFALEGPSLMFSPPRGACSCSRCFPPERKRRGMFELAEAIDWKPCTPEDPHYEQVFGKMYGGRSPVVTETCLTPYWHTDADAIVSFTPTRWSYRHHVCAIGKALMVKGAGPQEIVDCARSTVQRLFPNVPDSVIHDVIQWNDRQRMTYRHIAGRLRDEAMRL